MKTNIVLIDYENVQPKNLSLLNQEHFFVLVFLGEHQTKISLEIAKTLQPLGNKADYIRIDGNGANALDFHIAFYIGKLAKDLPNSFFHIISKDKGFDPLIRHLKSQKILCARSTKLEDMPLFRISEANTADDKVAAIIDNLKQRGSSKPRKEKTLLTTIQSLFRHKNIDQDEVKKLLDTLKAGNLITVDANSNVSYKLDPSV
ncbi:PIN domain-containing protein [Methylophilus sp. OH31]|uniref:PIN domain-containing protein n=1 Tax=Methylophilus sp. OH31 TaxID=1387312 RepID=UPI000466F176|nr:PIN domain-containing protein [Methylophilus sp. OH31]